jgi:hypothetical protein
MGGFVFNPAWLRRYLFDETQFLDHFLAHDEFLHFAGHRHGEAVNKPYIARNFVMRDLALAEGLIASQLLRGSDYLTRL